MTLTFGSLFAGIGGFDLGLERAGMRCVWQVEIDPFCRRVLAKHWPDVRRHDDVKTFPPQGDWACDLICGGFPCQDISIAGKGVGIDGPKSRLWREFMRVVCVLRPRVVLMENSPALANRGLSRILGALAELGYDAEWAVLPASAFGACHIRARMFVVAYLDGQRQSQCGGDDGEERGRTQHGITKEVHIPDTNDSGIRVQGRGADVKAPSELQGETEERQRIRPEPEPVFESRTEHVTDPDRTGRAVREEHIMLVQQPAPVGSGWWAAEPDVVRMVHGFPGRVDRIRGLGNAVMPQVAEWIGRRILEALE